VLGKVPTISVDKTDGCQMYLSQESLDVEIISSKSSEMNVLVPKGNGDFVSIGLSVYASVEILIGRMDCE
jgi:adenylyl cyclase-associated protein